MPNRCRILEAAARVYAKHGFRGATTRLIAQEAGVNEVTLFRLFGSKGALLEAVLTDSASQTAVTPLPETPADPPTELAEWVRAGLDTLREMRPLLIHAMGEREERPEADEFACRGREHAHEQLRAYARKLQQAGLAAPNADLDTATVMLISAVMGDVMGRPMVPHIYPDADEAAERYAACFLRAIGVDAGASTTTPITSRRAQSSAAAAKKVMRAMALLLALALPAVLGAQQARSLTLDEAIRTAARESEVLQVARAGIARASGQQKQAHSGYLPQVNSSLAYARTLRSQFSALARGGAPDTSIRTSLCTPPISATATAAERNAALAQAASCPAAQSIDFSKVGFGAKNQYTLGLSVSQNVFTGGRLSGQNAAADAQRRAAEVDLVSQRAQLALDVTQAYFDAVLADRLVGIADSTLAQTEELLRQTTLARRVGNQSEFELLRATVTRDNQRPVLITRRGDRDVAYLRLKQLLNLPLDEPVLLATPLDEPAAVSRVIAANAQVTGTDAAADARVARLASDTLLALPAPDTATADRAPVRESAETVRAQEGLLKVARADRLPTFALNTNYQRLFYPSNTLPSLSSYSENWTVGGTINLSLFSGGRVTGQVEVAQANLDESRARFNQARELAALDTRVALNQLQAAEAAFNASRGTAQQAQRAYGIDQIRYREGISTQTDLTQSRLLLEQSLANRALSARDLAVARARVALIRDLPINTQALGGAAGRATSQPASQQPSSTAAQRTTNAAGVAGAGPIGSNTP